MSNKMEFLGVAHVNMHVLIHVKEELGWVIDKRLWFNINKMLV